MMKNLFGYGSTSNDAAATPNLSTPLTTGSDLGKIVGTKANEIKDNTVKITEKIAEINRQNPSSYRTWKILSGVLMMASSGLNFVLSFVKNEFDEIVLALYSFFFGFLICLMEARTFLLPEAWRERMYRLCRLLDYTWGKGAYFISVGVFQASQGNYQLDFVAGFFTFLVGLLCLSTSRNTNAKLRQLHAALSNGLALRTSLTLSFSSGGYVNRANMRHFFATHGIALSSHELESVFDAFDTDRNEKVSVDEFCLWYDALAQNLVSGDETPLLV